MARRNATKIFEMSHGPCDSVAISNKYIAVDSKVAVHVWRSQQPNEFLRKFPVYADDDDNNRDVTAVAIAGERLVVGTEEGTVHVWDIPSGNILFAQDRHIGAVLSVSAFGDHAVSGSADGIVIMWNLQTADAVLLQTTTTTSSSSNEHDDDDDDECVYAVAMSDEYIVAGTSNVNNNSSLRVWCLPERNMVQELYGDDHYWTNSVSISGTRIVTGGDGLGACVWQLPGGTQPRRFALDTASTVNAVAMSEKYIVTGAPKRGDEMRVWCAQTYELLYVLQCSSAKEDDFMRAVAISGECIVAGMQDGPAQLWIL